MRALRRAAAFGTVGVLVLALVGCGRDEPSPPSSSARDVGVNAISADEFSYAGYDALLAAYVDDNGMVDYSGIQSNREALDRFVASMGAIAGESFDAWSEADRMALWINAYNAITLQSIIDHYPIQKGSLVASLRYPANSIRQIPGVWDELEKPVVGRDYTLEAIEHEILRVEFSEPRIHVAIVCASIGCPPLRNEAYVGERIEEQLADQSRKFLADPAKFTIDRELNRVSVSPIFSWFGKDFAGVYNVDGSVTGHGRTDDAVIDYIRRNVSEDDAAYLLSASYRLDRQDYDWSLNVQ